MAKTQLRNIHTRQEEATVFNMYSFQKTLLVILATVFCPDVTADKHVWVSNDVVNSIKNLLIHQGDKLTNATQSKHTMNQNEDSFVLSNNIPIVNQIINILNCGPFPNSPNSHLQYYLDYAAKRLILLQACDRYFKTTQKTDSLQVSCKYKKWIFNKIDCKRTTCPPLTAPIGGHISTSDNTYNATVYFWCARGFSINGTDKAICQEDGHWNLPPPTCEVSHCHSFPAPRHGFVSSQQEIAVNETVEFRCESEYSLIGDAVLKCQNDGRWNTSAPVCKKMCIVPDIKNQSEGIRLVPKFESLSVGSLVHLGQRVIFSCKPGYKIVSGLSTCIGGYWVPPIQCRKTCTAIKVDKGTYILSKDFSTIEYSCQPGYHLVGQRKLSCTSNLTWDNEAPICTKMCTLPEQHEVLSFRNTTTYKIIPFGSQIINGTKVYSVCRRNTKQVVTECFDGELHPYPCLSRLQNGRLEIYNNGNWYQICSGSTDLCKMFGYAFYRNHLSCTRCYNLDENTFRMSQKIILSPRSYRFQSNCVYCN